MTERNEEKRPLWFVMLVLLSVLPVVVWLYAYQKLNGIVDGVSHFVLDAFPLYVFAMLGMAYYVFPARREVANVLLIVTWLSYIALGAMAAIG